MSKNTGLPLKYGVASVLIALSVCVSTIGTVSAATTTQTTSAANGFQISPVRSEITISKGQSKSVDITITNPTNASVVAQAIVNDFDASTDESGDPRILLNGAHAPTDDFKKLVGPIPDTTLPAHASKEVMVTISVPNTAASGGYYGAIRFAPTTTSQQSTVGLTASVGTLFLITVPGDLIEKVNLTQLSAAQNSTATSFITSGSVEVMNRLDNVGNIQVQPFGKVLIKDMFNHTVASYEFNNTTPRANVLPDSIRKFIDPVANKKWFGRYTIQESLAYSNGSGDLITASASFWYLPVWFLLTVAVVIILIVALIYRLVTGRQYHRRR